MSRTFDLISKPEITTTAIADDVALAREGQAPNEIGNMSARFLAELFGDRTSLVNGVVARRERIERTVGFVDHAIRGRRSRSSFLGRHVRTSGLDLNGFTQMSCEREELDHARRAAGTVDCAWRGNAARVGDGARSRVSKRPPHDGERLRHPQGTSRTHRRATAGCGRRWRRSPFSRSSGVRARAIALRPSTRRAAGGEVVPVSPTMPTPTAPISTPGSGAMPDTSSFAVPGGPIETTLVAFINDTTQHPSDVDAVRLRPPTCSTSNSAKLMPQSEDQLENVAMILKAHPNVIVRISGYTDSAGTAATNLKLAAARAAVVRAALIRAGASASHLQSQGRDQSMADTSAGAALGSQHVSLLVIKK